MTQDQNAQDAAMPSAMVLDRLAEVIKQRHMADAQSSYTASLLAGGVERCAQKFGEEAVEAVIALTGNNSDDITSEAADVIYHLMVALQAADVSWHDVLEELNRREGKSGHDEKARRGHGE